MLHTLSAHDRTGNPRGIAHWLLIVAGLVLLMVVVGGITRLTESGLSMVRWEPIRGIIPPLNHAQWQAEFQSYQTSPQFRDVNRHMSLSEFKGIYFWEYVHRLIGRLIGLAFALPLAIFWIRRQIPTGYGPRLILLLVLGGMQGVIGWWMVASGLVDNPAVSHFRLATHLLMALLIVSALLWTALDLYDLIRTGGNTPAVMPRYGYAILALLALQLCYGAFVAGLDAGFIFAEWPMMGDGLLPSNMPRTGSMMHEIVSNPIVVQFIHRWLAFAVAAAIIWLARKAWLAGLSGHAATLVLIVIAQIILGISTLLSGVMIPLAVAHQGMGALLLMATVTTLHALGARKPLYG